MLTSFSWIYTELSTVLAILCSSCQSLQFSFVVGQRITSGITELRKVTIEDMTAVLCATYCGCDCGTFHFSFSSNECTVFVERDYDPGVVLTSDPDWVVGYRKEHIKVTHDDWRLVFRAQKSIGVSVWDTWSNTGAHDDNPVSTDFPVSCLRLSDYSSCDRHFRSNILDDWTNVKEVRFSLVKSDTEVAYVLFNGTGTSRDSWFSPRKILASSWSPAIESEPEFTSPGVSGYQSSIAVRRFHLFGPHLGCASDWLYTFTIDMSTDSCIDNYGVWPVTLVSYPNFFYSPSTGRASMLSNGAYPQAQSADVLAVLVKFAT